jgi:putative phosphoribosyl transferase
MYFKSRTEAGDMLAKQIVPRYQGKPCVVVALSDGSVVVAAQIALKLHAMLSMLLVQPIMLPREDTPIGGITEDGSFAYNGLYSPGEIEELVGEYHSYIEAEKTDRLSEMHRLVAGSSLLKKELLEDKTVILVSDGLSSGFSLDVAAEYLKPIHAAGLVVATPLATVPAVDRMHILADAIFCLTVVDNFITVDHYYDTHDVPKHEAIMQILENITKYWQEPAGS